MRHLDEIIVHCSATRKQWMDSHSLEEQVFAIKRWHTQDNGWSDIGYHYIIGRDGGMAEGRPLIRAGAHTLGKNKASVGICLIGGHGASAKDNFFDHFTAAQKDTLIKVISHLQNKYPTITKVSGHNQYANKGCPGFYVPAFMAEHCGQPKETEPMATEVYRWRLAEIRDLATKALEEN